MGDVFKEQIVKRQKSFKDTVIKACIIVLSVLISFWALINLAQLAVLVIFALFFGARYGMSFFNVEYEYALTNGELDIDVIYDRARRKRVLTVNTKSFEVMAHIDDRSHDHSFNTAQQTLDYSTGVHSANTYAFLTIYKSKKVKVIIEPNEKMLKAFSMAVPRRQFHLKSGTVLLP